MSKSIGIKRIIFFLFIISSCFCALFTLRVNAKETENKTIKVGYYPVANYQEIKADGTYFGFSYDYFMQIQKYTRWDYEFVEASYADCLQMLIDGDIDVMSGIAKTSAREKQMIFSDYSVSNAQNKLYTKSDNGRLFYESYDTFNGCKVAVMKGMLTTDLEKYSKKHGFSVQMKEYISMSDMEGALLNDEVDMIFASSVTNNIDTKIVARMDKQPLYFATANAELETAKELDDALQKIIDNNPNFYTQMSEKYMISGANAAATFTREEEQYIQSGQEVYIIVNANWAPITWYDERTSSYKGIFIDVINRIEEYSGLHFVLCTEDEFNEKAVNHPDMINNVVAILADDNGWAVQQDVMMSNHVVDSSVVMVTKRGKYDTNVSENMVIALPKRFYIGYVMRAELEDKTINYYDTVEDCLKAVNSGKADATYVNELVATYYLSMLTYSKLFATANSGYYENLAFAVNKNSETPLFSILDKSLLCLGSTDIEQIVVQNSIAQERFSIKGLYYTNPELVFGLVIMAVILVLGIVFVIGYMRVRKKRTERELQKEFETSNARTEFFMMISHELRTPLNAIIGYLDKVEEEHRRNGWEMEYIKRSQNAAKQLTNISEDMLDYTRIASDTVEMHEDLFDLKEVIMNVDQNISLKATKKDLNYRITIHNMSHEYIVGDKLRITQIMQNLLSNGIKFTDAGGKVEASVSERILEKGMIELTFICKDTGKGMSEEFLKKVCAPFNQSDKSYSRTHGGLGLGLYLTKYFVSAMRGSFKVESILGEGSTFTIVLPLKRPNSEQILENAIDCSHVRAVIGGINQEDNTQLKELLKRLKIKCDTVTDTEKLIKRIISRIGEKYEYSLCVIDETMLYEGFEAIDIVSELEHSPVIFVVTSNSKQMEELSVNKKVCQVLYKPIFQSVLFDAVMNTFGEYEVDNQQEITEDFSGVHAMIVEDNMVNADILMRVLKKVNVDVSICENGKIAVDAFESAEKGTYQIVFMDIQMPIMNGYEAAERIRKSSLQTEGATIPIVAVSANAFPEDIEKSLQAGMNEHLSKPVDREKLYNVIKKYVKIKA